MKLKVSIYSAIDKFKGFGNGFATGILGTGIVLQYGEESTDSRGWFIKGLRWPQLLEQFTYRYEKTQYEK